MRQGVGVRFFRLLLERLLKLREQSLIWRVVLDYGPAVALVLVINHFVGSHFREVNYETADTNRRVVMLLIAVIALCLSVLLRGSNRRPK